MLKRIKKWLNKRCEWENHKWQLVMGNQHLAKNPKHTADFQHIHLLQCKECPEIYIKVTDTKNINLERKTFAS